MPFPIHPLLSHHGTNAAAAEESSSGIVHISFPQAVSSLISTVLSRYLPFLIAGWQRLADNNNENMKDAAARIVPVILKMSKNLAPGEQAKVVVFLNEFNERLEADRQIDRGDFSDSKMSAPASFGSDK